MSYPGHFGGGTYLSAEVQSVYSTASADWAIFQWSLKRQNILLEYIWKYDYNFFIAY